MKKNLLFASSVFTITLIGLLVFCEVSKDTNDEEAHQQEQSIENQTNQELVVLQK